MLIGSETSLHFSYQISFAFQHCDSIVWRGRGMKGRTSFRSHGVALAEQYVKALEGGLKEKILLTWNGTFLMICGNKEGGLRKKAHMEWHFL